MHRILIAVAVVGLIAAIALGAELSGQMVELRAGQVRVIDGDTIEVRLADSGIIESVRIIGLACPELPRNGKSGQPYAREAEARAWAILGGQDVLLALDPVNTERGHRDDFHRLLAHVRLTDGSYLAEALIAEGLCTTLTRYEYDAALRDRYLAAEASARAARLGIWIRFSDDLKRD